jgi:uncharacterized membrane protein YfcA
VLLLKQRFDLRRKRGALAVLTALTAFPTLAAARQGRHGAFLALTLPTLVGAVAGGALLAFLPTAVPELLNLSEQLFFVAGEFAAAAFLFGDFLEPGAQFVH